MNISPYVFFNGNCREAVQFYAQVLGAEIVSMITSADTPLANETPPEQRDKIMHARLKIGESTFMASDAPPEHYSAPQGICINHMVAEPAEAERIFAALSVGGTVQMPIEETFFARRFGMVKDRFGTPWMIYCEKIA